MAGHAESPLRPLAGAEFRHELEMESLRARRGRCPLSLVLFAPDVSDCRNARGREARARELLRCIASQASPCDSLGLLPELRYALILPGAGVFRAQKIAEQVLQLCAQAGLRCAAGIAGAESQENAGAETLLEQAVIALRQGLERDGRAGVYREEVEALSLRKTLVHSHEKRFLFSGGE